MQLPYLPPLLPLLLLLLLPFSHRFWGVVFLFFFSAILIIVLFSPFPLMMIMTYYLPVHIRLFFLSFFFFWFFFAVCGDTKFLEKQASRQQFEITVCSLDWLVGWLVGFPFFSN